MGKPVVHWQLLSKDPAKLSEFYGKTFDCKIRHIAEMNYHWLKPAARAASTAASCGRSADSS
jgi:predicted enzyme related to lactoylglutathione lyase